MICNKQIN